jgi:catalase
MIQPKQNPLEKVFVDIDKNIHTSLLKPKHYTADPLYDSITRNVDYEIKKEGSFSEIIDDFTKNEVLSMTAEKGFQQYIMSTNNYHGGGSGDLDTIIATIKNDIKKVDDKIIKIRKQQMVHAKNKDYMSAVDQVLFIRLNEVLDQFGSIHL